MEIDVKSVLKNIYDNWPRIRQVPEEIVTDTYEELKVKY